MEPAMDTTDDSGVSLTSPPKTAAQLDQENASSGLTRDSKAYKTALCQFYLAGPCNKGDECCFAHGTSELRSATTGQAVGTLAEATSSKSKTKLCERFLQLGSCPFGSGCSYAHGVRELQMTLVNMEKAAEANSRSEDSPTYKTQLCKNYMEGFFCQFADKCGYAHGKHELRSKPILKPEDMTPENKEKLLNKARSRPDYKSKMCTNFESTGKCQYSELCVFAHGKDELRDVPDEQIASAAPHANSPHFKTLLCKYGAKCTFGPKCTFAHNSSELRPPPMPNGIAAPPHMMPQPPAPMMNSNAKTAMCKNFQNGTCPYGDKCTFAHGSHELRRPGQQPQQQQPFPTDYAASRYKTMLCTQWRSEGYCDNGIACNFAHGTRELRQQAQADWPAGPDPSMGNKKYKTTLCQQFSATGRCEREATCAFAHGEEDLRGSSMYKTVMCKNLAAGGCPRGENCHFAHTADELRARDPPVQMGMSMGMGMRPMMMMPPHNNPGGMLKRKQSLHKTSLCQNFRMSGQCQYGDTCNFAHGEAELQINKRAKY